MPIRFENKNCYPDNWPEIRKRILERAGNKCESCGAGHGQHHPETGSVVVLTIMHLDHIPENCAEENLKAACQKCHNFYDMPHRIRTRKKTREQELNRNQYQLFPQ